MEINTDFFGGAVKRYYPNIGEVVSFVPRYRSSGSGFRNEYLPRRRLGYGWGSTILSFFKPFLKKGLHAVVNVASKVASDAIEGQNVKQSLKEHGMKGISNLLQKNLLQKSPVEEEVPNQTKKRVNPATARRKTKQKVEKPKKSVSGSGKKKSNSKKVSSKQPLTKKYPILEYM